MIDLDDSHLEQVFCYSEDLYGNLQYSQSAPLTLKTTVALVAGMLRDPVVV